MTTPQRILCVFAGLIVGVGAAAAWHYWHVDGFVAVMVAFGGAILVERGATGGKDDD